MVIVGVVEVKVTVTACNEGSLYESSRLLGRFSMNIQMSFRVANMYWLLF